MESEGEKVVGGLFRRALNGDELPRLYEVGVREIPFNRVNSQVQ